jgi:UPF0716 protein FxsA
MVVLVFLFIAIPVVELALLIEVGSRIGTLPTLGLIVVTGVVGAGLARMQGLAVLQRIHGDMSRGELPASALVDGVIILMAAALLITPGILTDAFGFLCLIPAFRSVVKRLAWDWIRAQVQRQRIHIRMGGVDSGEWPRPRDRGPVYDIEPENIDQEPH